MKLKNWKDLEKTLEKLINKDPDNQKGLLRLGLCYKETLNYERANTAIERLLSLKNLDESIKGEGVKMKYELSQLEAKVHEKEKKMFSKMFQN